MKNKKFYLIPALLVLFLGGSAIWKVVQHRNEQHAKIQEATQQVKTLADKLDGQRDSKGYLRKLPSPEETTDPWGNPITVVWEADGKTDHVYVTSPGPDGELETEDDIKQERQKIFLVRLIPGQKDHPPPTKTSKTSVEESNNEESESFLGGLKRKIFGK